MVGGVGGGVNEVQGAEEACSGKERQQRRRREKIEMGLLGFPAAALRSEQSSERSVTRPCKQPPGTSS